MIKSLVPEKYRVLSQRVDSVFSQMVTYGGFNGAVIVCKEGEVIYQKAFGIADKENNIPVTDSTMFQLASVSKVITATSVLMLAERGLINLDDAFSDYFPEFPYTNITVKHLLSHRSGLPNYLYFLNDLVSSKENKLSNKDVLEHMISRKPALYLKPDKAFNYCNTNYALLALLVEKVSGKDFSVFLQEEIFEPLGMKHSGTIHAACSRKEASRPYDHRWKAIDYEAADYVLGDKSIYSTPYDLFLFSEALYQNKILNSETQELAFSALSREKKLSNYGLGWRMRDFKSADKKEVYHNGWWHGYRTAFHRRLKDKVTIVVLSNQLNRTAYHTWKIYQALDAGGQEYNDLAYEE
jgi:CubicO group peptidase (beta-lactamase class C family)